MTFDGWIPPEWPLCAATWDLGTIDDDRSRKNVERSRGAGPRLMMVKEFIIEHIVFLDYVRL